MWHRALHSYGCVASRALRVGKSCPPENTDVSVENARDPYLALCLELLFISVSMVNVSLGFKRGKNLKEVEFKAFN